MIKMYTGMSLHSEIPTVRAFLMPLLKEVQ
nr:MAG TPA_asm: hypothetical protein [Caudoviricetes sp.]